MGNFQNDCCHPWTKNPFKNSCSRQLRIVNAVVKLIAIRSDRLTEICFSPNESSHFESVNSNKTKVPDEVIFRSVLLHYSMSKLIHNQCKLTCKLLIKTIRLHTCMQTNNWVPVFMF